MLCQNLETSRLIWMNFWMKWIRTKMDKLTMMVRIFTNQIIKSIEKNISRHTFRQTQCVPSQNKFLSFFKIKFSVHSQNEKKSSVLFQTQNSQKRRK